MFAKILCGFALTFVSFLGSVQQAQAQVNLSGTWVGKGGSQVTFTHRGSSLSGPAWGGPNNSTLSGSVALSGGPTVFHGSYQNQQGNFRGWGSITVTVDGRNTIFVSYRGFVSSGGRTVPVSDSYYCYRR